MGSSWYCWRIPLNRVWTLVNEFTDSDKKEVNNFGEVQKVQHKTIKKVTEDFHRESLNTAIAALMEMTNELYKLKLVGFSKEWQGVLEDLLKMLAPFAPHMASELWEIMGNNTFIDHAGWPKWDDKLLVEDTVQIMIQVNGKLRGKISLPKEHTKEEALSLAKDEEKVKKYLAEGEIIKEIFVPNKLINFVVK